MSITYTSSSTEIWEDIPNYVGLYQVSNLGRIKSLDKIYYFGNTSSRRNSKEYIKALVLNSDGYHRVALQKDGIRKDYMVHVLVGMCFLANPFNYKEINHKDGIKINNVPENLEWCSRIHNIHHARDTGLWKPLTSEQHGRSKLVLNTQTGIYYDCITDAAKAHNMTRETLKSRLHGNVINNTNLILV